MKRKPIQFGGPQRTPRTRTQKTDEPLALDINALSLEGRGVARHHGKTVFVSGALPGEKISARITQQHKRYDEAECVEVLEASPQRQAPICKHYGQCGGCDLQHLDPGAQIQLKQQLVLDQLQRFASVVPAQIDTPLTGPDTGYRRSARIGINQRSDGQQLIGFRRRASHKILDIDSCPVLEPRLNQLLAGLRNTLSEFDSIKHLTHADISCGDTSAVLALRVTRQPGPELSHALAELCRAQGVQLFFEFNENRLEAIYTDAETLHYCLDTPKLTLDFAPGDFLQVNAALNREMVSRAMEWLDPGPQDHVLDLFCGLGNFTLPLARRAGSVVGVEGSAEMIKRASHNATRNGLENVQFFRSDLSADIRTTGWYQQSKQQGFDLILLDPPRAGASETVKQLVQYGARSILYVSCNPAALVRDTQTLTAAGYSLARFCVMDMFPHTAHVESLALFSRAC